MIKFSYFSVCILCCIVVGMDLQGQETSEMRATRQLLVIKAAIQQSAVGRVEVLEIPADVLTRTRITPEMLEKQYLYKLTIRDIENYPSKSKLFDAINSTSAEPVGRDGDFRWGIIFYRKDETRIGGIYFDGPGKVGSVDHDNVVLKGNAFTWLRLNFSKWSE